MNIWDVDMWDWEDIPAVIPELSADMLAASGWHIEYGEDWERYDYDQGAFPPDGTFADAIAQGAFGDGSCEFGDTDGDGLPDLVEMVSGTEPFDGDTDNDGLTDGGTGTEDLNNNGIVDPGETDPRQWDTDGDGISDGVERGLAVPEGPDTDLMEFMPDEDPSTTTDPTDPDTDGDGLLDGEEDADGNGAIDPGEPDPNDSDTDADGLDDGDEVIEHGTDPVDADTDDDGLDDGEEVNVYLTDPVEGDTDGDGVSDGTEVATGTDPTDQTDYLAAVTYDGDTLLSTEGAPTVDANLVATIWDNDGYILAVDNEEVIFTLTAEGIETIPPMPTLTQDGVADAVETLEPAIYTVEVTVASAPATATAFLVVYNPEGGFATGGGWIVPEDDGENTYPNVRANFGFNAKYKKGLPTGHIEFRYKDGYIDLKSSSIEQLVITGGRIAQFKGWASVNGEEGNWFFAKAIDNGEPGKGNDTFDIKIWAPGLDPEADDPEKAGGVLQGGNIVVHKK